MAKHVWGPAALLFAAALWGCAAVTRAPTTETVTISRTQALRLCLGLCPFYTVTVRPSGEIVAEDRRTGTVEEFSVGPVKADEFRRMLSRFRPSGEIDERPCRRNEVPPEIVIPKVKEIEVRWIGHASSAHLIACDNGYGGELNEAIRKALRAIHVYPNGRRITPEDEPDNPEIRSGHQAPRDREL